VQKLVRKGFDSTVDLFGDQTVQVVATAFQAALMLLAGVLLLVLSVRVVTLAIVKPMLAPWPQCAGRLVLPDRSEIISDSGLRSRLPARGPPSSRALSRFQDPPGDSRSG
jgi:hypothetical protein